MINDFGYLWLRELRFSHGNVLLDWDVKLSLGIGMCSRVNYGHALWFCFWWRGLIRQCGRNIVFEILNVFIMIGVKFKFEFECNACEQEFVLFAILFIQS